MANFARTELTDVSASHLASVKPIKVLQVLESTLGGTLRYLENIAEATQSSRIKFGFAYGFSRADSRLQPFLKKVTDLGWSTYPIDMRREINLSSDFAAFLQLRQAVSHFAPDVVHCHSSKAGALGRGAMILHRKRPARLYSPHGLAVPIGRKYLKIEKVLATFTDSFVAVSESERREIVDFALAEEEHVGVVYPSIDTSYFIPSSRERARGLLGFDSDPLILSIGRITAQKNPASFIKIVQQVHARRPDVKAIWMGAGVGELDFGAIIKDAGMEHVIRSTSWQHDVRDYIAAADVLLSSSNFESFGYVTAEALSMSRPVVATDVMGTRDIMTRELQKWLYPVENPERGADLVLALLESPDLASAVGKLGRSEMVARFSKARMREALIETYVKASRTTPKRLFSTRSILPGTKLRSQKWGSSQPDPTQEVVSFK
jgi:glycosyltransferase involved in cell wall biosynthesis